MFSWFVGFSMVVLVVCVNVCSCLIVLLGYLLCILDDLCLLLIDLHFWVCWVWIVLVADLVGFWCLLELGLVICGCGLLLRFSALFVRVLFGVICFVLFVCFVRFASFGF